MAILASAQPCPVPELMAYQAIIAKVSTKSINGLHGLDTTRIFTKRLLETLVSHGPKWTQHIYPLLYGPGTEQQQLVLQVPGAGPHHNKLPFVPKEVLMEYSLGSLTTKQAGCSHCLFRFEGMCKIWQHLQIPTNLQCMPQAEKHPDVVTSYLGQSYQHIS